MKSDRELPSRAAGATRHARARLLLALALGLCTAARADAPAEPVLDPAALRQVQELGQQLAGAWAQEKARIEIEPGQLDPRLRLAPCQRIEVYLPGQARAWGRTRVGLRCVEGPSAWSVYLPVTVKVFAPAWVASQPLPAGTLLEAAHLSEAEVDWAAERSPAIADDRALIGRVLARPLAAGQPLRAVDLRQRQWFAAGDTVQLVARGAGFSVSGAGQALAAGIEGRSVRVRTESGRVISGQAVGANRVEVLL